VAVQPAIFIVDDDAGVREFIRVLLEFAGFANIKPYESSHRFLEEASLHDGDCLLLDLRMPGGLNGSDVREQQLTTPELAAIPTVVVSATEADGAVRAQLRADAWIEKPFRFDDLLAVVRQYVTPNA